MEETEVLDLQEVLVQFMDATYRRELLGSDEWRGWAFTLYRQPVAGSTEGDTSEFWMYASCKDCRSAPKPDLLGSTRSIYAESANQATGTWVNSSMEELYAQVRKSFKNDDLFRGHP